MTTMDLRSACSGTGRDRAQARRARVIDAARTLFVTNGFHATGVAQIARLSGVAVGQIYRDFEAKEDIVAAIVEGDCHELCKRESLRRAIAAGDADGVWEWLRDFLRPDDGDDAQLLFAEIIAESTRNDRIAAIFSRAQADISADMLAALALLAPGEGLARRRDRLAEFVLTQSLGIRQYRLLRPGFDAEGLVELVLAIVARETAAMRRTLGVPA